MKIRKTGIQLVGCQLVGLGESQAVGHMACVRL